MGYTGEKAMAFKIAYIARFNEMEEQLRTTSPLLPNFRDPIAAAEAWIVAERARLAEQARADYYQRTKAEIGSRREATAMNTASVLSKQFVAKDVCVCLEIGNSRDAVASLDDDEKGVGIIDTPGGKQEMSIVSEPGLYSLILRSRKPEAKAFKRWVTHDILPSIRKTGAYVASTKESPRSLTGPGAYATRKLSHIPDSIGGGVCVPTNQCKEGMRNEF